MKLCGFRATKELVNCLSKHRSQTVWVCSGYIKLLSVFTELCEQAKKRTFFSESSFIYSNRTFKWLIIFVWPNLWYHLQYFYNSYKTNINIFASIDWTRYTYLH